MAKTKLQKYIDRKLQKHPHLRDEFEEILEVYNECVAGGDDENLEYLAGKDAIDATIRELSIE